MIKAKVLKEQVTKMMPSIEKTLLEYVDHIISSGCLSEEDYTRYLANGDSYALAKVIITAWFESKPYTPISSNKELTALCKRIKNC